VAGAQPLTHNAYKLTLARELAARALLQAVDG
jgi:CO/xanthine dehydrogenase FAD-binding subunit